MQDKFLLLNFLAFPGNQFNKKKKNKQTQNETACNIIQPGKSTRTNDEDDENN